VGTNDDGETAVRSNLVDSLAAFQGRRRLTQPARPLRFVEATADPIDTFPGHDPRRAPSPGSGADNSTVGPGSQLRGLTRGIRRQSLQTGIGSEKFEHETDWAGAAEHVDRGAVTASSTPADV